MGADEFDPSMASLTYFYDFIENLEKEYAFASVAAIAEDIQFARSVGPALAGLKKRSEGVYVLVSPIGRGDFAHVELEFDGDGVLQPVMGGFIRK